jgi:quinol---cytochrome c reductase cytochrome c subunit, bacillus type
MPPDENSNPLERTPDMASLSPSERARIYKERAAAAGIGRPPAAGQEGAAPAPAAPAPAPAPAEPAAPAAPARAAAGGGGAGAAGLTPEQRQRLAAAVQRGGAAAPAAAPAAAAASSPRPASGAVDQSQRLVYVWPHLVTIELMASVLLLVSMIVISMVIQAPLEGHANTDKTPNPSKAPWYFLNLQELLLHMHPALAGVLIPAGALALIAIIPYFDRDTRDVGKWFGTPKSIAITWFTTWYTAIVLILEVIFDEEIGVKPMMTWLAQRTGLEVFIWPAVVNVIVPMIFMNVPIIILVWLIKRIYKPDNARDWMVCLFTGFFVSYIVLTIVGTFMRGQGMHLMWPWDVRMIRVE